MNTQHVETKKTQAISTEVYDSLIDDEVPTDKMIIPRVGLVQAMSKITGEKILGTYHNNVTNENYGETITVIPIKISFGALYMVKGEGMKCKSADGITNIHGNPCVQCPFNIYHGAEWKNGEPPDCNSTIDILAIETTSGQPSVITFKVSNYKEGKKLVTNLKLIRNAIAVVLGSKLSADGTYHVMQIKSQIPLTPEQFQTAMKWKANFKTTKYEAAEDGEEHH